MLSFPRTHKLTYGDTPHHKYIHACKQAYTYMHIHTFTECLKRVPYFCHCTGRKCGCGETLKDSIIHFKENLPEKDLIDGFKHGDKADLCLVLGSSLTVSPACHIPRDCVKKGGKLVIVNLQKTPYDQQSELRIFAKIDEVMHALMGQLGFDADQDVVPFGDSKYCQQELTRVKEEAKKNTNTPASASPTSALISSSSGHSSAGFSTPNNRLPVHNKHTDKGGAVIPRYDCPHMSAHVSDKTGAKLTQRQVKEAFASGCAECKDESENWICRQCGEILCGRYVNEHMVLHAATTQHLVVTSLSDLQTWCYGCEAYCIDSRLDQGNAMLYLTKFGALPPGFAKAAGTSI